MNVGFDKICRTCMVESSTMLSIFDKYQGLDGTPQGTTSITEMLSSFTAIRACSDDGLPYHVCLTCLSEINRAISFKQKCERSEHTLKSYLHQASIRRAQGKFENTRNDYEEHILNVQSETNSVYSEDIFFKTNDEPQFTTENSSQVIAISQPIPVIIKNQVLPKQELIFKCGECSQSFQYANEMTSHMNSVHFTKSTEATIVEHCNDTDDGHKDKFEIIEVVPKNFKYQYKCSVCFIEFCRKRNLTKHYKRCHGDLKSNPTAQADAINITNESIKLETASTIEKKCNLCGGKFATIKSLNIHQKLNKCTAKSFVCDICQKVFVRKRNLTVHMLTHVAQKLSCPHCPKQYARKDQLAAHMLGHSGTKRHPCPYCSKGFNMLSTFKDHLRTHNGERPYLCSICGKGFSQSTNLKQHLMRHSNTKPFKCTECTNTFVSKGELDSHLRKHTGDHPFVCDVCGSGFTTSSSLSKHRRIHTGERPYACDFCPMRFTALGTLKNHRRTHTGERPFRCNYCDRGFAQRSDCVSHQRTHTGERPYSCKECNKSFLQHSTLKTHMKTHKTFSIEQPITIVSTMTTANEIN